MAAKSDSDLLEIVTKLKDDYQPEAVEAAKAEIERRNLSADDISQAEKELEIKDAKQIEKENEPLDFGQKFLFFIFFWGVIPWAMAGTFMNNGYTKKYKDAWKYMKLGLLVFVGIPLVILIVLSIVG